MGKAQKSASPKSVSSPRTSDDPSFLVDGPWDTAELLWLRCSRCSCTNQFDDGDMEALEILTQGFGLHRTRFCLSFGNCPCHTGIKPFPVLRMKRSENA